MKHVLVTGGAGFIGSNFITYFLKTYKDYAIINLDNLTYAGNPDNLRSVEKNPAYTFIKGDIGDPDIVSQLLNTYNPDYIVNFAAESHVDRSIDDASIFGKTNVMGTLNLLECARKAWKGSLSKRFLQISTDEVYGSLANDTDFFIEESNLKPNSPYSASKAGADLMAGAYFKTYHLPVLITRCCNNYGPLQHPEKFIPTCIRKALQDEPIPVYGDGKNIREWIHVLDHCEAIARVLFSGIPGQIYNIGSGAEITNLEMVGLILRSLGKPGDAFVRVSDRPGHDRRYALDSSKTMTAFDWHCRYNLLEGLQETIDWYVGNRSWWDR